MTRRIVGLTAATLLALVGTAALVAYVSTAEQRALAGEQLVEVYVVAVPVPIGTSAAGIADYVTVEQVPVKVQAAGAIDSLQAVTGKVTAVDLVPGEQLVASRFIEQSEVTSRAVGIEVPEDKLEVTIEVDSQRAVGGLVTPGQTISVFASFDPFGASESVVDFNGETLVVPQAAAESAGASTSHSTDLLLTKVLVTAVQTSSGIVMDPKQRQSTSPDGPLFVTLALDPFDAERLVFTAEFGNLWLAIERESVPDASPPGQSRGSVLNDQNDAR